MLPKELAASKEEAACRQRNILHTGLLCLAWQAHRLMVALRSQQASNDGYDEQNNVKH
ncbi:MAG: hypothetical protein GX167_07300 [Firmicutes bacterium]|jgi:hypothetical protein|nr:hypothetical protein [Bacillota bacterium]